MSKRLNCIILDVIYDDYHTVWEILSVIDTAGVIPEGEGMINALYDSLNEMLDQQFVNAYKGVLFEGEEREIEFFKLTKEFILKHKDDWKTKGITEEDIRFYISDKGKEYYSKNCDHLSK